MKILNRLFHVPVLLDMAKRRTYEERLLDKLMTLEINKWFRIDNHEDFNKITKTVKNYIDHYEPFEFSNDFTRIRRIRDARD